MSDAVYLYGFVPAAAPVPPADLAGVADAPVRLIDLGEVRAAVSDLTGDVYSAESLERRMQDLVWVGEQGLAHERVVVWFADHSEILPARMFGLYSGDAALRSAVSSRRAEVSAALRALTGRREWNLKVAYDTAELARHGAAVSPALRRLDEEMAAAAPGRRYLLERKRSDMLKHEVARAGRALAHELLDVLRTHAEDVRVLPQTEPDDAGSVLLNAALLVTRDAEPALRADAERLHEHYTALGMIVSFSGPWAPYRFVEPYGDA
jgi:hypothetical protein